MARSGSDSDQVVRWRAAMCADWYSLYLVFTVYLWKAPDVDKDKWQQRLSRWRVARNHLATSNVIHDFPRASSWTH